jgi:hypothetical protein
VNEYLTHYHSEDSCVHEVVIYSQGSYSLSLNIDQAGTKF